MYFVSRIRQGRIKGWRDDVAGIAFVRASPGRAELEQLRQDAITSARESVEQCIATFGNRGRTLAQLQNQWRVLQTELVATLQ